MRRKKAKSERKAVTASGTEGGESARSGNTIFGALAKLKQHTGGINEDGRPVLDVSGLLGLVIRALVVISK